MVTGTDIGVVGVAAAASGSTVRRSCLTIMTTITIRITAMAITDAVTGIIAATIITIIIIIDGSAFSARLP